MVITIASGRQAVDASVRRQDPNNMDRLETQETRRGVLWFVVLTLSFTMVLHLCIPIFGLPFSLSSAQPSTLLYLAGLAMPSLVALALTRNGRRIAFICSILRPGGSILIYLAAAFAQLAIVCFAWQLAIISDAQLTSSFQPGSGFLFLAIGQVLVILGEEPGWRGFLLPRLLSMSSPRVATIAIALVWGVWHVPMFFVAGSLQAGASLLLFASSIFAWSMVHTALYLASRPSIVPNLIFHGTANVVLNTGLVPAELEPYLLSAYVIVGLFVWIALPRIEVRMRAAV